MSARPIRIVHVAKALGLGGTEKVLQSLCTHLDPARFDVSVCALADGERGAQLRQAGIATHIGPDLTGALERIRPDIVHVHRAGWPEPELMRPIRAAAPAGVVETNVFGRHDPSPAGNIVDVHLFVSRFCLDRYAALDDTSAAPPTHDVLYNPVDTDFFSRVARTDRDFSRPVAGRISRADPGKWSRLALDILPLLARRIPEFRYHVIGAVDEARRFVREHGLTQTVVFHDPVATDAEIAAFLDGVSAMAHANDTGESFGLVIAEAMACGLPVVTHPCPWPKDNAQLELVEHQVTGLVAETAEDYAGALAWLFEHPDKAREMGRAGQRKAAELYRAQHIANRLETVYTELLKRKGTKLI